MSSEYTQAGLPTRRRERGRLFQPRHRAATPSEVGVLELPLQEPEPEPPLVLGRFQPGALSPVGEHAANRSLGKRAVIALRGGNRLLDWGLLAAEIGCAVVVAWLVAQYIFTVYFDTAPRQASPSSNAPASGTARATAQVPSQAKESNAEVWDIRKPAAQGVAVGLPESTPTATPYVDPALLLPSGLRIPAMFLNSPIHEVTVNMGVWEVSPMEIGHHEGTANPGDIGNVVLAGHRDINSALFRELDRLKPGDEVFVSNSFKEFRYVVTDSFVVSPAHIEVMDPTNDKRVTLITCTPIGLDTQRLIVTAILED